MTNYVGRVHPSRSHYARIFYGTLAALLFAALCVRVGLSVDDTEHTLGVRLMRLFSFFTIQSNIAVMVVAGAFALDPRRASGDSTFWRVAWLAARGAIVVTGLVYFFVLRPDDSHEGLSVYTNIMFHYVAPLATVVGWAIFGPWHKHDGFRRDIGLAFIWPAVWVVYTLIHGAIGGWYPYDFVDIELKGYAQIALNLAVNTLEIAALFALFIAADNRWVRRRDSVDTS